MTREKVLNLKANKCRYLADVAAIDKAVREIALSGTASAMITSSGGSKSYTRLDVDKLLKLRDDLVERVASINRALRSSSPAGIRTIEIRRS